MDWIRIVRKLSLVSALLSVVAYYFYSKETLTANWKNIARISFSVHSIAVIGIAAVISAVCVAGMLATKENAWRTPEELLVEYMYHIPKKEYEEMYAMLHVEASGSISQEDFVTRNSAIYEGIEVQNIAVQIIAYDEEQMTVTYQTSFDTVAGTISF
jgi:penicillin-binding protein